MPLPQWNDNNVFYHYFIHFSICWIRLIFSISQNIISLFHFFEKFNCFLDTTFSFELQFVYWTKVSFMFKWHLAIVQLSTIWKVLKLSVFHKRKFPKLSQMHKRALWIRLQHNTWQYLKLKLSNKDDENLS